ncbi:AAA family ATPase [Aeromonas sp. QDB68]|uniref:AAA family ATPase n=1 Tax=Aeromonas sp. QDB68 TaxID=2989823 RepID=UPI0022E8C8B0|nr:AAA family ATPase [Aeromonas sp. QDB68]
MNTNNASVVSINNGNGLPVFKSESASVLLQELGMPNLVTHCVDAWKYQRLVPDVPNGYLVPVREARKCMLWASSPTMKQSLLLRGETGTGKTEFVMFLAARLNIPLARVECHASMLPEVVDGGVKLIPNPQGEGVITRYVLSDVMRLYRDGGWILLDEVDKVSDELSARLHAITDGKPVTIPETGEVIYKHPNTKVFGTSNTIGDGTSVRYLSSRPLDAAFRARWAGMEIKYLTAGEEMKMLEAAYPQLSKNFLTTMVQVANELRDAALGPNRDGDIDRPMDSIYSMRTQRNLLDAAITFGANTPFIEAVNFAYRDMLSNPDKEVFDAISQRILGNDLTQSQITTKELNKSL